MSASIPFIPGSAPFTPEQRAWLNGYFVGLLSTAHGVEPSSAPASPAKPLAPLLIGFGSQSGTAEGLAKRLVKESSAKGFSARALELNQVSLAELEKTSRFLLITSTWGDGDPPDNATEFWKNLSAETAPCLDNLSYSVLSLGDKNYADFCGAGRKMDERLAALGAARVLARADCDVDYEAAAKAWCDAVWPALPATVGAALETSSPAAASNGHAPGALNGSLAANGARAESKPAYSRAHPFPASLLANRVLNGPGSAKETRHIEISLDNSPLVYEPGDALGVVPRNCPEQVAEILRAGGWSPGAEVTLADGARLSLEEALLARLDLRKPPSALLEAAAQADASGALAALLAPDKKSALQEYLGQREVIDLLLEFPGFRPDPALFAALLAKLQPRLYSISSSLAAFPRQVHLTVGIVRYQACGRPRKGLCSTFLADRVQPSGPVPVFIQASHGFKLPKNPETPIIMVGPGTGIAPFRAFLHERQAAGAKGKNWLFFGDQQGSCDFLYREELDSFQRSGLLTRLDTAFSRDQAEKIYVQNRMAQNAPELFDWLEQGAHFYVCGDAKRMAKDVDAALHQAIQSSGKTAEQAAEYIVKLKEQKRYQRDVY